MRTSISPYLALQTMYSRCLPQHPSASIFSGSPAPVDPRMPEVATVAAGGGRRPASASARYTLRCASAPRAPATSARSDTNRPVAAGAYALTRRSASNANFGAHSMSPQPPPNPQRIAHQPPVDRHQARAGSQTLEGRKVGVVRDGRSVHAATGCQSR